MGKRWTDKEDTILETLREGGMTYKEMASIMGRTSTAIHQRAYVLRQNEPTFREVVDTAFAKHGIEFGEPDKVDVAYEQFKERLYPNGVSDIYASVQKNKPKPQWWKAMMWWRK
jgi:hypothetical protein